MSSSLLAPRKAPARRRRRTHGRLAKAWVWVHRWASLVLGLALLAEVVSGVVLLYPDEIDAALGVHRSVVSVSADPVTLPDAMRLVQARYPEITPTAAHVTQEGGYLVEGAALSAWVDPGTGRITSVGDARSPLVGFMVNLHVCGLTCADYPGYVPWLATPLPWVGEYATVGGVVLRVPGDAPPEPPDTPAAGSGPVISVEDAVARAVALHPGARLTGLYPVTPDQPGGMYGVSLTKGYDPYAYSPFVGSAYVAVDSHGGGVIDYRPEDDGAPIAEQLWEGGTWYGIHFGTLVPGVPRIVWLVFGLTPVLLAVTGVTVWLTKRRSKRNRRAASV